jgi:beta-N-acetylhexosaminidase
MAESRFGVAGQAFLAEVRKVVPRVTATIMDPSMARQEIDDALGKIPVCETYAVAAFASTAAYRGSVGLAGELPHALEELIGRGRPLALIALGSPYLLRNFPNVTAYLATFSGVPVSELAAAKAILGEIPIRGRLPVTIPGVAAYGDGIQLLPTRPLQVSGQSQ